MGTAAIRPMIGSSVHYTTWQGQCRAAIVAQVNPSDTVDLATFEIGNNQLIWWYGVCYTDERAGTAGAAGHWTWPVNP